MRIVLRDDVENVGRKGDLVEVADGYARNFLVPRGLALKATKGVVEQAESMRRSRQAKEDRDREAATELSGRIAGQRIEIGARAGEGGRLFGSVTAADIAEAIQAQAGIEVDRHKLGLGEPLKELGPADVTLKLHPEVEVTVTVDVVATA